VRHLGRQFLLVGSARIDLYLAGQSVGAAEDAARWIAGAVVAGGTDRRALEKAPGLDRAHAAAPASGGRGFVAQLVALAQHRRRQLHLLQRVVAGIGHQRVHGVEAVAAVAAAVRALVDLDVDLVLAPVRLERINEARNIGGVAPGDALRQRPAQRRQDLVGDPVDLGEARLAAARVDRVEDAALRGVGVNRAKNAVVLRHARALGGFVQQQGPHREVHGRQHAALEGAVEAGRGLRRGAGQVHADVASAHQNARRDLQRLAEVLAVVLQPGVRRRVLAVGQFLDPRAHPPLGVVHPLLGRAHHAVQAVLRDKSRETPLAQPAAGDHRLEIAGVGLGRAHVVHDQRPEALAPFAGGVQFHRIEDLALGEEVRHVHGESRVGGADVHHVAGAAGEADVHAAHEQRQQHAVVGTVRCAVVRVVVQIDVAGPVAPAVLAVDAAHVGGQGAAVHGRGVALAQLPPVEVQQRRADVARLAHHAGIGHAHEQFGHLVGDGVQRAADHLQRNGVHLDAVPAALGVRAQSGAARLVESGPEFGGVHGLSSLPGVRRRFE